jgi:methylmalonyl-CoA mutase
LGGGPAGKTTLAVHMCQYQNAGANRVQELAYGLSHMNEYLLRMKEIPGIRPLLEQPVFLVAIGNEYFFEIAKLRALRRLWELLAQAAGLSGNCRIFAFPTQRNKTLYDYNTNMLRTTTECMAAVLGGADMVVNSPYDSLYHKPNAFADRIARNQLLLLRHESYFASVSNPADGTYYIASLTEQLGKKALELFKTLEQGGGFLKQLREHRIQNKIRESAQAEQQAFDQGRLVLVGSNKYPNPDDGMKEDLQRDPFLKIRPEKTLIEPIFPRRLSEGYEQKRLGDE